MMARGFSTFFHPSAHDPAMKPTTCVAFDLGAESGRTILGTFNDGLLKMQEVHRFANGPVNILGHLHWDIFRLFDEMKSGLKAALKAAPTPPVCMGIDTWGVDFALLDGDGTLLGLPYAYRDKRTDGAMDELFREVPREEIYRHTGIQFMQFNSLVQLFAMRRDQPGTQASARHLLFIPDALTYLFTGIRRTEYTFATTSQLLDPRTGRWVPALLHTAGVRPEVMQEIVQPGTVLGPLHADVARECGAPGLPVVAVATHDTASAVASVPAGNGRWAYISSGTWSLLGVELPGPIITDAGLAANFTNEGGIGGTIRFLKNIMGLWLLQECRRAWGGTVAYDELIIEATAAPSFRSLLDPDQQRFYRPANMPEEIARCCRETGQPVPTSKGEFTRCILESLALKSRFAIDQLRNVLGHSFDRIHIIGGGSKNAFLCHATANAAGIPVTAGPVEGTAIGNLLVQGMAMGIIADHSAGRAMVRRSFELKEFLPEDTDRWEEAYTRFRSLAR